MPANTAAAIARSCEFSHYLTRLLAARPEEGERLERQLSQPFTVEDMQDFADWPALQAPEQLAPALRRLRQAVMARLICRDLNDLAPLDEVVATVSQLAEFAVRQALRCACASLPQYGKPIGEDSGEEQQLIVIGMGKLGGGELNVSSDIDLIFIYPESGETDGARKISNHEYFTQVASG